EKSIDEKDKIREQALRITREIIIGCRKAIQCLHQNLIDDAEKYIEKAYSELSNLYSTVKDYGDLYHAGFVENAAQEVVEAKCLLNILKGKDLPDPDEIKTTYNAYLMGLCDVVGELRRSALEFIRAGDNTKADEYLKMMESIYDAVIRFDYPSALVPIRKKQDMIRGLVERTRGELAIASCEKRINEKTHEFHGLLDKIDEEEKHEKKTENKKNEVDLDIDKIW
ncbi:MAG: RNA-binding protein, partial [Thermoplasmatota archaeon]